MPAMTQTRFATLLLRMIVAAVLGFLPATPGVEADDWPQFRGPRRDGYWEEKAGILESFPKTDLKIKWRQPVGGGFFLFTDEGNLIRAELSPTGYREMSRAHLIDPTWPFDGKKFVYAPPAFANRHVFARNEGEVVCASLEKR